MLRISLLVAGIFPVIVLAIACSSDPPPATPTNVAPSSTVDPSVAPIAPGYNQGYQQPGYTPTAPTASAVAGQMSNPGPTALACENDSQCMFHHCNMQFKKCSFPCQSDADCIQGSTCFVAGGPAAICMPKP